MDKTRGNSGPRAGGLDHLEDPIYGRNCVGRLLPKYFGLIDGKLTERVFDSFGCSRTEVLPIIRVHFRIENHRLENFV